MAKSPPPPEHHRFRITCECDVANLGVVMFRLSHIEGLTVTGNELITEVSAFNTRRSFDTSSQDFLLEWIKEHPTFRASEAVKHFTENGRTASSCYPGLATLVDKRILKKLGPGQYSRADVKAIAAPKKGTAKEAPKKRETFAKPGRDVVLSYAKRNHGRFNTRKIIELFEKEGRARNGVYGAIDDLLKKRVAKRIGASGSGEYVLVTRTEKPSKPTTNNTAPPQTVEETSNG